MEMVRVNAMIRKEDREFLRNNRIGVTELINSAIFQRKNEIIGLAPTFEQERGKREVFQKKFSKALIFMEKQGIIQDWIDEDSKPETSHTHGKEVFL
jgi:hypothetical protein